MNVETATPRRVGTPCPRDAVARSCDALSETLGGQRTAHQATVVSFSSSPLPDYWQWKKLKYVARVLIGLTYSPEDVTDSADGVLVLRSSNVQSGNIDLRDCVYVNAAIPEELRTRPSDILLCSRNGSRALIGKCARIGDQAAGASFGAFMSVVRAYCDNDYLFWVLSSHLFESQSGSFLTATINQLTTGTLNSIELPLPPLKAQRAIAAHLDRETAKIDLLIAKKRELIEKLKEQRSALISRVVTRGLPPEAAKAAGLNPNPPMKDSGVEWLGEVPEHWRVVQLKRVVDFVTSGSRGWANFYSDSGSIFVRIGNLTRDTLVVDLTDVQHVTPPVDSEGERTRVLEGDLLLSITAYLGSVAVAPSELQNAYVSQHVALARPRNDFLDARYGGYCVLSDFVQGQLASQGYGGTKVQLSLDDVLTLWIPLPLVDEQRHIARHLDLQCDKLAKLVVCAETVITSLTEYRAALITAAVTGQIEIDYVA